MRIYYFVVYVKYIITVLDLKNYMIESDIYMQMWFKS